MKNRLWSLLLWRPTLGAGLRVVSLAIALAGGHVLQPTQAQTVAAQSASPPELAPAPTCSGGVTPQQTEGPYYKPNAPQRTSLIEPGMAGQKLVVTGYVLTPDCQPIAGARLDFWQADANGAYDNAGYRMRGQQYTDETGRYYLETVVPGEYPGRTPHIHVKVQAPNQPAITTQVYFPGQPRNSRDGIFNSALLLAIQDTDDGKAARFDFVLDQT